MISDYKVPGNYARACISKYTFSSNKNVLIHHLFIEELTMFIIFTTICSITGVLKVKGEFSIRLPDVTVESQGIPAGFSFKCVVPS